MASTCFYLLNSRILPGKFDEEQYILFKITQLFLIQQHSTNYERVAGRWRTTDDWQNLKRLERQNVWCFTIWFGFLNNQSFFVNSQCRLYWEKLSDCNPFSFGLKHWRQDCTVFPAFCILIGQLYIFGTPAVCRALYIYKRASLSSKSNNYILYGNSPACGDWVALLFYTLKSVTLMWYPCEQSQSLYLCLQIKKKKKSLRFVVNKECVPKLPNVI